MLPLAACDSIEFQFRNLLLGRPPGVSQESKQAVGRRKRSPNNYTAYRLSSCKALTSCINAERKLLATGPPPRIDANALKESRTVGKRMKMEGKSNIANITETTNKIKMEKHWPIGNTKGGGKEGRYCWVGA